MCPVGLENLRAAVKGVSRSATERGDRRRQAALCCWRWLLPLVKRMFEFSVLTVSDPPRVVCRSQATKGPASTSGGSIKLPVEGALLLYMNCIERHLVGRLRNSCT